ncbi:MAG: hypothetical protein HC900_02380 [Methylacidiphilales bacterium]|nr:hypothetical protein [Candidatus Methylacidiphilales bacterium]
MARAFWTTLAFTLSLQVAALSALVAVAVHDQASVVSTTLHRTAHLTEIAAAACSKGRCSRPECGGFQLRAEEPEWHILSTENPVLGRGFLAKRESGEHKIITRALYKTRRS